LDLGRGIPEGKGKGREEKKGRKQFGARIEGRRDVTSHFAN